MTDDRLSEQARERMNRLPQTGRGTPMGELLRTFWHPIALSEALKLAEAKAIRVMGENLTLYRGESGKLHLVDGYCPHRRTLLHTGWIQDDKIRCMYHGWQFDGAGRCIERPAEDAAGNAKVSIASYPVREYAGLVFAYLGQAPIPEFELARKPPFEAEGALIFAREETWPCNWFQQVENSLDAVHVSFVHHWGDVGPFGGAVAPTIPKLEYEETDAGIRQTATRSAGSVRVSNWTFPNNNHIAVPGLHPEDPWIDVGIWMTPVDDGRTTRFTTYAIPSTTPDADRRINEYFEQYGDYDPADHHYDLFVRRRVPNDKLLQLTSAQDYVAAIGQGEVADRELERLGASDRGIVLLRRIFWREMELMQKGSMRKQWRRLDVMPEMPKQKRDDELISTPAETADQSM